MNRLFLLLMPALLIGSVGFAQNLDPNQEVRLLALVREVQTQQAQLAENQAKIEEKLNEVAEIVKDARLYSKRAK